MVRGFAVAVVLAVSVVVGVVAPVGAMAAPVEGPAGSAFYTPPDAEPGG